MRCWQQGNGPWRWIFFDGDATLINDISTVFPNAAVFNPPYDWNNFPEAKLLFGKLLKNERFRNAFTARAEELCQSVFSYENTFPLFNSIAETLGMKIYDQQHRFGYPYDIAKWNHLNQNIKDQLMYRVNLYLEAMYEFFNSIDVDEYAEGSSPVLCYPNPTKGTIWIRMPSSSSDRLPFALYDMTGRLILSKDLYVFESENVIPIEVHLPSGLYLVKIGNVTKRLAITK